MADLQAAFHLKPDTASPSQSQDRVLILLRTPANLTAINSRAAIGESWVLLYIKAPMQQVLYGGYVIGYYSF